MTAHTFEAAIRDAGRRRLRTLAAGGGAAALAVALLALVPHPTGSSGLAPAGTLPVTASPSVAASVSPTPPVPAPAATSGAPGPSRSEPASPSDPAPASPTPARRPPQLGYSGTTGWDLRDQPCAPLPGQAGTRSGDWCLVTTATSSAGGADFRFDVCSATPQGGTLEFAGNMARVVLATTAGEVVWQSGPTNSQTRSVHLDYERCVQWYVLWNYARDGRPVGPGSYVLRGVLLATNASGQTSVTFTLT